MGRLGRFAALVAALLALIAAFLAYLQPFDRCVLDDLAHSSAPAPPFFVTFLGVATLLIDDGADAILIDGYFTRPSVASGSTPVTPDHGKIEAALETAQITTTTL